MSFYTAFNLNFQSEVALPELLPGPPVPDANIQPDVTIRHGHLGKTPEQEGPIRCERASKHEALLSWGGVALVLVNAGKEIVVDPAPQAQEDALRLLLTGAAMAVLLHQRGLTVLHASAVAINGQVIAFIGDKGAGKSSTAAALCARGHPLITDDLLAVRFNARSQPIVMFGYPQIKIWPDTAETLGMDTGSLARVRSTVEKRAHRPAYSLTQTEFPLKCICVLGVGEKTEIFPLNAQMAFFLLMRNLYVSRFGDIFQQPGMAPQPFQQTAALLKSTQVLAMRRKAELSALPHIAQMVEETLQTTCQSS